MALEHKHQRSEEDPPSVLMLFTEIIVEILSRLPVDSLLRCRSVCKSWRSLISDPHFVKSHLNKSTSNYDRHQLMYSAGPKIMKRCHLSHVLYDKSINGSDLYYPPKHVGRNVSIIGSCNGLVCMTIGKFGLSVWNPSTRKFNIIPNCNRDQIGHDWYHLYGFGYQASTDNYKIVKFSCNIEDPTKCVISGKIYSLKDGSWKEIGFPCRFQCYNYGKFSNGALHWSAKNESKLWTILSIDLATESYREILQPAYDAGDTHVILGSLGEWLCVLCTYQGIRSDLWVMKDYGVKESWAKFVSFPYLRTVNPWMDLVSVPFCGSNDRKLLFRLLGKIFVYDSKTSSISEIENTDFRHEACTYVESLVSPMPATSLGDRKL